MSTTDTAGADAPRTPDQLFAQVLARLQAEYARAGEQPTARAAATMAALRTADPGKVNESPATWDVLYRTFPDDYFGGGDAVAPRERAAHAALVLYAVHQASQPVKQHQPGVRPGQALRRLPGAQDEQSPVLRRFASLMAASTFDATVYHLRSLMTLLRRERIPLDHVALYRDLIALQDPRRAAGVRRRWGRDYFSNRARDADPATTADASELPSGAPDDLTGSSSPHDHA